MSLSRSAALAIAILVTLTACGGGGGSSTSTTGDFVIGLITVTSGPAADVASVSTRGSNIAANDVNAAGGVLGRHVRLEYCDNGSPQGVSDPQKTLACARRFLNEKLGAVAIEDEGSLNLVVAEFGANKVFTTGGYSEQFDDPQKYPYVFSLVSPSAVGGRILAELLRRQGVHRVATMSDNSASQIASTRTAEAALRAAGIEVVDSESFGLADVDVSAQTSKVGASHPDVVWSNSYGLVVAHIVENFNNAHVAFQILGSQAFSNTPVLLLLGLTEIPNLRLQTFTSATVKAGQAYPPQLQHLVDGLHNDGKGKISALGTIFLAEYGYDLVSLISNAYNAAGSVEPAKVRSAWEGVQLTRASGAVYTQDIRYSPGHHSPACDAGNTNVSFGRLPDTNGVLTEAIPPLGFCP